jgi:hypothetical protein
MRFSIRPKVSVVLSLVTMFIVIGALVLAVVSHQSGTSAAGLTSTKSGKRVYFKLAQLGLRALTDAQCRARIGVPCYSPQEMRTAYGVASLINAGFIGKGQTIVIIDSFGSPTIAADLHTFIEFQFPFGSRWNGPTTSQGNLALQRTHWLLRYREDQVLEKRVRRSQDRGRQNQGAEHDQRDGLDSLRTPEIEERAGKPFGDGRAVAVEAPACREDHERTRRTIGTH